MSAFGSQIRVGVIGAGGRMGSAAAEAIRGDSELALVAAIDHEWNETGEPPIRTAGGEIEVFARAQAEVVLEFSNDSAAAFDHGLWCADRGIGVVIGTSGITQAMVADLGAAFGAQGMERGCVVVPNFALGAVVLGRLAEIAARFAQTIDIIDLHHESKIDAPSGTAMDTARRIGAARDAAGSHALLPDPTRREEISGSRGAEVGGVRVHAIRAKGMVAHEEVIFGMEGQTLSIRHDSYGRDSFMPGVLVAIKAAAATTGVTVGLASVLGL